MAGIKALVGETVLNGKNEKVSVEDLCKDKQAIGIYFSAHWCPPCRGFTPVLAEFYNDHQDKFAVIFVSSDRDEGSFNEYFGEMPWHALDFADRQKKQEISEKYGVRGIPTLVILRPDGSTISENGRGDVAGSNGKFPESWK